MLKRAEDTGRRVRGVGLQIATSLSEGVAILEADLWEILQLTDSGLDSGLLDFPHCYLCMPELILMLRPGCVAS